MHECRSAHESASHDDRCHWHASNPTVPTSIEAHSGFADERARYVTHPPLTSDGTLYLGKCMRTPPPPNPLHYSADTPSAPVSGIHFSPSCAGVALSLFDGVYHCFYLNPSVNLREIRRDSLPTSAVTSNNSQLP
jgi:hypothetical protein